MSDPKPKQCVAVTIGGQQHELVPTDKLTFPEGQEIKRVTRDSCGIAMSLQQLETGIQGVDGDAWFAWIYVSIRRTNPTFTTDDLVSLIGDTPILAVVQSFEDTTPPSAQEDPLTLPSVGGSQQNENGSGEKTPGLSTLETAGQQT